MTNNTSVMQTAPTSVVCNFFDPQQFEVIQRVSKMFAMSDLVPESYKPKVQNIPIGAKPEQVEAINQANASAQSKAIANCMIALDLAGRIGANPLMVMQNLNTIQGHPSWSAKFLIATINTCGRFDPLEFEITDKGNVGIIEYTDYVWNDRTRRKEAQTMRFDGSKVRNYECVAYTSRTGKKSVLRSAPVSVKLAISEGWYTKNGSKWPTMTKLMLMYRAASQWASIYAPEISLGMKTTEEIEDITENVDYTEISDTPADKPKRQLGFMSKQTDEHEEAVPADSETPVADSPEVSSPDADTDAPTASSPDTETDNAKEDEPAW